MAVLDKYSIVAKPPKITNAREKADVMQKVNRNFLAGLDKQIALAKAYKPGAKEKRSWVTRDADAGNSWITVRYGNRPIVLKGTKKTTIGPVPVGDVAKVFEDVKKAHGAGELESALKKVAMLGPRKKQS